ncbi:unnamed protein product [Malus baccata var. baccata]
MEMVAHVKLKSSHKGCKGRRSGSGTLTMKRNTSYNVDPVPAKLDVEGRIEDHVTCSLRVNHFLIASYGNTLLGRVLVAHKLGEEKIVGKLFHDQQVVFPPLGMIGWQIALPFLHQFPLDHQSFSHSLLMVESEILD